MSAGSPYEEAARAWLAEDPDPATRAELAALLALGDETLLAERFGARLQFGTAGLRGELGAGPNRMNRALVRRAAAGLAAWLHERHPDRVAAGVVVGRDARHGSVEFADDTCAVLAGAGIASHLLPGPLPTPVLAWAVRHLGAAAGVMVTASHNPPRDNGYKVYDHVGAQIVPPVDAEISAAIDAVGPLAGVVVAPLEDPLVHRVGPEVVAAYVDEVVALLPAARGGPEPSSGSEPAPLSIVYSPMHGVGGAVVEAVWARAGLPPLHRVIAQAAPDPDFPTVAFPNPEEPGAMDLALAEAAAVSADLVLVNDPDADRLAVAVPVPAVSVGAAPGGWRALRGDEVGVLLADAVLADPPVEPPERAGLTPVLACSLVSSQQLRAMAAEAGIAFEETLTGFKWIARAPGPGRRLLFGYEEALGYSVGDLVGDKDGISAALAVAQRSAVLRAEGSSLLDRLDELSRRYGLHVTRQRSFRQEGLEGLARIKTATAALRADPPNELAGRPVTSVDDLADPANGLGVPPSDVLVLRLGDARVIVRPSGTEPKLKCYLEVVRPVGASIDAARTEADAELDALDDAIATLLALD